MRDPYWNAAWVESEPHFRPRDRLLLPAGEWPASDFPTRLYDREILVGNATVIFLHKGKLGAIKKKILREIMRRWQFITANAVFVCYRKPSLPFLKKQPHVSDPDVCKLYEYVHSARLKQSPGTVYFSHIPKTAGTSVWSHLSEQVKSSIYYESFESFRHNPPARGEYDLVGGHVPLPLMLACADQDDHVVGLVREPTARFRSAFLHSRRPDEDPSTFTPVMRAMRGHPLSEFLATQDGQMEVRQQLLMLGFDYSSDFNSDRDAELLRAAESLLNDDRCLFRPTEDIDAFISDVSGFLKIDFSGARLGRINASELEPTDRSVLEFARELPTVAANNRHERQLYELIVSRTRRVAMRDKRHAVHSAC